MRITKISAGAALTAGLLMVSAPVSFAGWLDGTWLRPKTGAHVKSFACGGGLGLKVIKSKKKSARGKTIMCGAKKIGGASYKGSLTSTEDGKTYSGTGHLGRQATQARRLRRLRAHLQDRVLETAQVAGRHSQA